MMECLKILWNRLLKDLTREYELDEMVLTSFKKIVNTPNRGFVLYRY
jgi:hypothetical protein